MSEKIEKVMLARVQNVISTLNDSLPDGCGHKYYLSKKNIMKSREYSRKHDSKPETKKKRHNRYMKNKNAKHNGSPESWAYLDKDWGES